MNDNKNTDRMTSVYRDISVITLVLFCGLLLSGGIFLGVTAIMDLSDRCEYCIDGADYNFDDYLGGDVNDAFYKSYKLQSFVKECDYILFKHFTDNDIIYGKDNFLFEEYDTKYDYNYVSDYIGEFVTSRKEITELAEAIGERERAFNKNNIKYYLAVIPNSNAIYSDKLPDFFGGISSDTRYFKLKRQLEVIGSNCLIDLYDRLLSAKNSGQLYHNTENSLNALGAYYVYREVAEKLLDSQNERFIVQIGDIKLYSRYTNGRSIAKQRGIEKIARNLTVSLPVEFVKKSSVVWRSTSTELTGVKPEFKAGVSELPVVLIDMPRYGNEDKALFVTYFSNTFGNVAYRVSDLYSELDIKQISPDVVVQFVHENALSGLLDQEVRMSYCSAVNN